MTYFSDLGLAEPILRALETKGYSDPTPIQRQAIPALLEGRDLLGIAQTGTGKTAAFALPSLHRLAAAPNTLKPASCRMLVLSPTRELAAQIADNMRGYAKYLHLQVECVFGGVPVGKQARRMAAGTDVLVATPGRLLDLIDQRALTLRNVEIFVLDEADQMMDLGFIQPLTRVAALLPKERQSLFFSATMPQAIAELGKRFINNPVKVEVAPQSTTAERVEQYSTHINQAEKQALLTLSLRAGLADKSIDRALVFTRTKHGADRVVRHLAAAGVPAAAIHGNKTQAQRTRALEGFRAGSVPILVATDIAARGIDVSGVSHVFNFELPNVAEQYVHRIGRTARAGADGVALSFVAPDERPYLRDIERLTGVKLVARPLPEDFLKLAASLPAAKRAAPEENDRHAPRGAGGDARRGRGGPSRGGRPGERSESRRSEPRRDDARRGEERRPRDDARREGGERQQAAAPRGRQFGEMPSAAASGRGAEGHRPDRSSGRSHEGRTHEGRTHEGRGHDHRGERSAPNADRGEGDSRQKRHFRPKGPGSVGSHAGRVRRAS